MLTPFEALLVKWKSGAASQGFWLVCQLSLLWLIAGRPPKQTGSRESFYLRRRPPLLLIPRCHKKKAMTLLQHHLTPSRMRVMLSIEFSPACHRVPLNPNKYAPMSSTLMMLLGHFARMCTTLSMAPWTHVEHQWTVIGSGFRNQCNQNSHQSSLYIDSKQVRLRLGPCVLSYMHCVSREGTDCIENTDFHSCTYATASTRFGLSGFHRNSGHESSELRLTSLRAKNAFLICMPC